MRDLANIIYVNARAAGREAAHAHNDAAHAADQAVMLAADAIVTRCAYAQHHEESNANPQHRILASRGFTDGWNRGKQEG